MIKCLSVSFLEATYLTSLDKKTQSPISDLDDTANIHNHVVVLKGCCSEGLGNVLYEGEVLHAEEGRHLPEIDSPTSLILGWE